ncbi:hypothetical protein CYMTET_25506 [Cymbomonas tetramitiformis]|uniref:Nucleotide-diphospho-sugar transferase domain-containing protein n=1 Tax=Cymbomonas tetramitiformis TaxID=36881 RepID=A0AAE0FTN6_9CHLO|nr:hypothetical protein CYMTET_25506 [Cymbomonas tetramitiformis]
MEITRLRRSMLFRFILMFLFAEFFSAKHVYLHDAEPEFKIHQQREGFTVVIFYFKDFRDLAVNVVANMRLNNLTNEIVGTTGEDECDVFEAALKHTSVLCSTVDSTKHSELSGIKERTWKVNIDQRWFYILQALRAGGDVLWVDCDVVFTRSPLPLLAELRAKDVDIATNVHPSANLELNTGIGYLRQGPQAIDLINRTWTKTLVELRKLDSGDKTARAYDQYIFTDQVQSKLSGSPAARLTWDLFQNKACNVNTGESTGRPCGFDQAGLRLLQAAVSKRQPASHANFTFYAVPDTLFGWKVDSALRAHAHRTARGAQLPRAGHVACHAHRTARGAQLPRAGHVACHAHRTARGSPASPRATWRVMRTAPHGEPRFLARHGRACAPHRTASPGSSRGATRVMRTAPHGEPSFLAQATWRVMAQVMLQQAQLSVV